ncbi:unnamed protein product [Victoria cruziana]
MGSGGAGGKGYWSVYDAFKSMPPTPDCLMAEVDAAIAAAEYAQSIDFPRKARSAAAAKPTPRPSPGITHEVRVADEAYRAACASLASGDFASALTSLRLALANCPPEKASAIAKIQSLISIASQQLNKMN